MAYSVRFQTVVLQKQIVDTTSESTAPIMASYNMSGTAPYWFSTGSEGGSVEVYNIRHYGINEYVHLHTSLFQR